MKLRRWARNLLLIFGGLVVAGLLLEIGLRLAGISYPNFYMVEEQRGLAPRPGVEGWYREEGEAYVKINSAGFRDEEHVVGVFEDTLRIAVLGDSFAEAIQVPLENTFWAVIEGELKNCGALGEREIEVLNFGVSGYGSAQELLTLRNNVWDYSPELVILAFVTGNDLSDNVRSLAQTDYVPYFVYQDGKLILDRSFLESDEYRVRHSWIVRLVDYSHVLQLINQFRYQIRTQVRNWNTARELETDDTVLNGDEPGLANSIYSPPDHPRWIEAWNVTEGILSLINDEAAAHGADLLVVTLSNGIQVHPDPAVREAFLQSIGASDLFYPDLRIKAVGERDGFPVLNLAPQLKGYAESSGSFLHGFDNTVMGKGHWNGLGHRIAGDLISQNICENFSITGLN